MKPRFAKNNFLRSFIVFSGMTASAFAAPITWDGDTDNTYEDGTNWVDDIAPANDLTTDVATFTGGAVDLSTTRQVAGLDFNSGSTLSGSGSIEIGTGGIEVNGNSVISTAGLVFNQANTTITFAGGRLSWGSGTVVSGTGKVTVTGNNTLFVDGNANTYSGGTSITGGASASIKGSNSLGTGAITIDNGNLSTNNATANLSQAVTIGAGGAELQASNGELQLSGVISGAGDITIVNNGSAAVYLSADNSATFTGNVIIDGANATLKVNQKGLDLASGTGTITLKDGGKLTANSGNHMEIDGRSIVLEGTGGTLEQASGRNIFGIASISGDGQLTLSSLGNDSGRIQLDNLNNTYTGGTLVHNGALVRVGNNTALGAAAGSVTFDNGYMDFSGSANLGNRSIIINGGGGQFQVFNNQTMTHGGVISGTGKLTFQDDGGQSVITGSNTYSGGTEVIGLVRIGAVGVDGSDTYFGSGAVTLNAVNGARGRIQNNDNHAAFANDLIISAANGGRLMAGWDKSLTVSGVVSGSGVLTIVGDSGTVVLGGANTHTGNIVVEAHASAAPDLRVTGSLGTGSYAGIISGAGDVDFAGSGTQKLTGTNSYTGATTVSGGELEISGAGSINSSSGVTVGSGATFRYNSSTALATSLTLDSGSTVAGTNLGTVAITVASGTTLSPGNSPGTMSTGTQTWLDGGNYNWQVLDVDGIVGTGFDTTDITGTLELGSLTAGGFSINLWSLASIGPDVDGDALSFSDAANYTWLLASTSGGVSGFDAADFSIFTAANNGTAGFDNAFTGTFSVSADANNLYLNYAAIPEPSAALLGGLGLLALLRRRRA